MPTAFIASDGWETAGVRREHWTSQRALQFHLKSWLACCLGLRSCSWPRSKSWGGTKQVVWSERRTGRNSTRSDRWGRGKHGKSSLNLWLWEEETTGLLRFFWLRTATLFFTFSAPPWGGILKSNRFKILVKSLEARKNYHLFSPPGKVFVSWITTWYRS